MKRCRHRLSEQLSQDRLPGSDDLPAANKADLGIATVEAVLVRRRREIAAWGHDPRRTGHKAFARLGEGLHANSRNAVDRSEAHQSEIQYQIRTPHTIFCLKKK